MALDRDLHLHGADDAEVVARGDGGAVRREDLVHGARHGRRDVGGVAGVGHRPVELALGRRVLDLDALLGAVDVEDERAHAAGLERADALQRDVDVDDGVRRVDAALELRQGRGQRREARGLAHGEAVEVDGRREVDGHARLVDAEAHEVVEDLGVEHGRHGPLRVEGAAVRRREPRGLRAEIRGRQRRGRPRRQRLPVA